MLPFFFFNQIAITGEEIKTLWNKGKNLCECMCVCVCVRARACVFVLRPLFPPCRWDRARALVSAQHVKLTEVILQIRYPSYCPTSWRKWALKPFIGMETLWRQWFRYKWFNIANKWMQQEFVDWSVIFCNNGRPL